MRSRGLVALLGCCLASGAFAAEAGKMRRVGPWNVGSFAEKGEFQHCIMARPEARGNPGFGIAKGRTYLTLALFSDKWKLDPGTTYPVTLVASGVSEEFQATVDSATTIGVALGGRENFVGALFSTNTLEVRTPATTLRLPMDRSSAALRTLNECYQVEAQVASNPFGAAPAAPKAEPANPFKAASPPAAPAVAATVAPPVAKPAAAAANAAADAAYAKARVDCEQDADSPRQIAGCTAVIESGRETREVTGIAYANRGFAYDAIGDKPQSLASFTLAIQFYPAYPNSLWGRGDVNFALGAYDDAIRDYTAAIKLEPEDPGDLQRRGRAYAAKGALDLAITDFTEGLRFAPGEVSLLDDRSAAYWRRSDGPRALADANAAIAANPKLPETQARIGDILSARGDQAGALKAYDQALRLSPGLASATKGRQTAQAAVAAAPAPANPMAAARAAATAAGAAAAPPSTVPAMPSLSSLGAGVTASAAVDKTLAERRTVAAFEAVGIVPQTCGYAPRLGTIHSLASASALSPELLEAAPYAEWRRAEADRLGAEIRADKGAFCTRAWAEYGDAGTSVAGLLSR